MSFLNIRGKKIHCSSCNSSITIEYKGGNIMAQIGDESVMKQKEINKKLMPSNYDLENEGYYYHDIAICKDCIIKSHHNEKHYLLVDSDYFIFYYFEEAHNIMNHISNLPYSIYGEYINNLSEDALKKMNEELFIEIKNTKTFGLKKEKRRLSEMFVEKSKEEIKKSYKEFIESSDEYKQLLINGQVLSEKYEDKIIESLNFEGPIYRKINYMDTNNLNPYIIGDTTVSVPLNVSGDVEFYEEAIVIDKKKVEYLIKNKSKFTLNNYEARKSFDIRYADLNNKIISKMVKLSYWK